MKILMIQLIALCTGCFLFEFMSDQDYMEAIRNSYWMAFGGAYVGLTTKLFRPINT